METLHLYNTLFSLVYNSLKYFLYVSLGVSLVAQMVKNLPANAGDLGLIRGSGRFPWRRAWQPIPVFLPGKFHGQRSLAGYSPRGLQRDGHS